MSTAHDAPPPEARNRLLAALPSDARARLLPHLECVALGLKAMLYESHEPIRDVYFPLNGVISTVAPAGDGRVVESGTVGNEGLVGLPVFLGAESTPGQAYSQVPGEALRLPAAVFLREATPEGPFRALLHRYTQAFMVQVSQSTACNRLHTDEQRGARWLLMTHDRVGADQFPLTQEFLGQMLGVRRQRVNAVAGALRRRGVLDYRRGLITVRDRRGLEAAACLCYGLIKAEYDRLLR